VRRHRLALGLSQEELAGRSGLSVRTIANMEQGRTTRPHRYSVQCLGDALGLQDPQRRQLDQAARVPAGGVQPVAADGKSLPAPRQLPASIEGFVGRTREMQALTDISEDMTGAGGAVVISSIGGTAGVGKTALAVHWARRSADRFPDGQLYINLRGYDPDEPVSPADALSGCLRTLGVPSADIPDGVDDRARLYRSKLADRRMLVLLDNARDSDQVRPLLPGDPGCLVLVTSRDTLAGLVATDGARRLNLDVLPLADAVGLLRSLIGPRAGDSRGAVAELAGLCARLPLALRIAAELAAARPTATLAELVAELAASRLDLLDAGDDHADVRAVFSWSLRQLPNELGEAFALIGLHPGADLDVHAAAALAGTTAAQARRMLGRLQRASLLQESGPGRYGMHDLLRAYAREQAAARDTGGRSGHALTRLFDYYRSTAAAAMDMLFPAEAHLRPRIPRSAAALPEMPGEPDAGAWLNTERANLVKVVQYCAGHDWLRHSTDLAGTLFRYLMTGSHLPEADAIYRHALHAAHQLGDLAAEASALNGLGGIGMSTGRFRDAADQYQAALEGYRRCGDRLGVARVLHNLGVIEHLLHNDGSAVSNYRQAITAYEEAGDSLSAARALTDLATAETQLGSYDQAAEHLRRALPVLRGAKDQVREAGALSRIGELNRHRSQLTQAVAFHQQALTIYRRIGNPNGEADQLLNLGELSLIQSEDQRAMGYLRQAVALYRQTGNQDGEIETLRCLAEALQGIGEPAAAQAELETALQLAAETGNTYQLASAHRDLADSHHRAGQDEQARRHWQQALSLYNQIGSPEADQVRSRLTEQMPQAQS
jgi:tetratricopeptide (TPR) repeat protein